MMLNNSPHQVPTRRARSGCLGCLFQTGVILILAAILLLAATGVFYPWAFYLGGKFHILPMWQGLGRAHTRNGDYLVWVRFQPTPRGSKMYLTSNLTGDAYLCTPRGENIRMHVGGSMAKHLNLSTNSEWVDLYMNYAPWNRQFITDRRPRLEFRGKWQNPDLVMDDHGSIARAFQPDGTVYRGHDRGRPYDTDIVPITFAQAPYSDFERSCAAMRR